MKLIGKGQFTRAYLKDDGRVHLESICPIKECMALGWFPEHRLFPEIQREGDNGYDMPYYSQPRSLKTNLTPRQYRLYKALRALEGFCGPNSHNSFDHWHQQFQGLPVEFKVEKEALREAVDACGNYGSDVCFEISPRNVAVKGGKLILLDCFFMASALKTSYAKDYR